MDSALPLPQLVCDMLGLLPDAALIASGTGRVIRMNRLAGALFKIPACLDGSVTLETVLSPVRPGDDDAPGASLPLLIRLGSIGSEPLLAQSSSGERLLIRATAWHDSAGGPQGWCLRLSKETRPGPGADDARLRMLAHDLRAPQSATLALLDLQRDPATAQPAEEFFQSVEASCRKSLRLTDGYMELVRAESQPLHSETIDYQEIVMEAVDEAWEAAHARRVYLLADLPETELPVRAERSLLVRALGHLLSNAVRHSPSGARVECTLRLRDDAGYRMIDCLVSDQGCGIAEVDQPRLFHCFQRLGKPAPSHEDVGAGLGLAFVKTVAERHGGSVSVTSTPGSGATFCLSLPAAPSGENANCRD